MPIRPNLIERTILLTLNQGPGPMLDVLGALAFKAIYTALKLGVFDVLEEGNLSAAELAHRIDTDERGTALLLQALEALGYVTRQGGRYANTPMASRWMARSSPESLASAFPYARDLLERWDRLDEAIRQGGPPISAWEWLDQHPERWEHYHAAMLTAARVVDKEILTKVKLPSTARRLIDLGGGHGLHAISFCRRYPALSAIVFDWPQARKVAEETIAAEDMGDQVSFQEGDFWEDDLGRGYDVALLFNIIHMYRPARNVTLLRKVAEALNPNARVIIMDQMAMRTSGPTARATAGLLGLDLFMEVSGQTYPPDQVVDWLRKAGFASTRWIPLRRSPGCALVVGVKVG